MNTRSWTLATEVSLNNHTTLYVTEVLCEVGASQISFTMVYAAFCRHTAVLSLFCC